MTLLQSDFYREEVIFRLKNDKIYQRFSEKCKDDSDNGGINILSVVENAVNYCYHRSKIVLRHMGEFTLHDGEHLFRVLRIMGLLIPEETFTKLSTPELALLILTAFFHDIGMAPKESEVKCWLGVWEGEEPTVEELVENQKYQRFKQGKAIQSQEIEYLRNSGKYAQAEIIERYLVTEYLRLSHADRVIEVIESEWEPHIKYKDVNLANELVQVCKSHNEDGVKLLEMEHSLLAAHDTYVCLPFIGVMLRLADLLDFDANRTPTVLYAHLGVKDPVSLIEWAKHRSVEAWTITPQHIAFNATCSHPAIEYSIRKFCDYIDNELISCASILANLHDPIRNPFPHYYRFPLPRNVDRTKINAKKNIKGRPIYLYRDTKFTLSKEQIIDLLMGTKLYGQPNVALRELIQNSIDACKLRAKLEENWNNASYNPSITIIFSKEGTTTFLEIIDNGVGMDQDIIDRYYSKVGSSYYSSSDFLELKSTLKSTFIPTSRFGIGILSCFMISDSIEVETKRIYEAHNASEPIKISIVGQESIFYIKQGERKEPGTATKLQLRKDNPWANVGDQQIIDFIKSTVPFPPFDIHIQTNSISVTHKKNIAEEIFFNNTNNADWQPNPYFKHYRINFDGHAGISGACEVSVLEENGNPIKNITQVSRTLMIENKEYKFESSYRQESNKYFKTAENLDTEWEGEGIRTRKTNTSIRNSKSLLSFHGIEVPMSMFASWEGLSYQYDKVHWPLCVLLKIDIGGDLDLNMNSARTEILIDHKWQKFESKLIELIFEGLKSQVSAEYWKQLKDVMKTNSSYKPTSSFGKALEIA